MPYKWKPLGAMKGLCLDAGGSHAWWIVRPKSCMPHTWRPSGGCGRAVTGCLRGSSAGASYRQRCRGWSCHAAVCYKQGDSRITILAACAGCLLYTFMGFFMDVAGVVLHAGLGMQLAPHFGTSSCSLAVCTGLQWRCCGLSCLHLAVQCTRPGCVMRRQSLFVCKLRRH